jgi:DNA replication protein DnaC
MALYGVEKPGYICSLCEDSGYKDGKLCSCVTDIAKSLAFNEMSSKMPVSECCFENFDLNYYSDVADASGAVPRKRAASILKLCKDFSDNFSRDSRSLLFMGDAGLGKTHLSLAIVSAVSAKGFGVVYGSAQNLFSAAEKEHFSYGGETDAIDSLLNCDLLVIDDLGTEFYSPYTASLFYNIINSRLLSRRPTVINTNLSFDELEKRYSARITSRFIGSYDMKKFIGNDIRQIKAME